MAGREPYDLDVEEIISIATIETDRTWCVTDFSYEDICVMCYAISGSATCTWDDQTREITGGDVLYFPAGKVRSTYSSPREPWTFVVIKFRLRAGNRTTGERLAECPVYVGNLHGPLGSRFLKLEEIWRKRQPGYLVRCKSVMYDLLAQLLLTPRREPEAERWQAHLEPALEAMEKNIKHSYSVPELAALANLSPSYFRTVFKRYSGYTPIQYQNYMKISRAHDLLQTGLYTVSEVAAMVGFHDCYYFSRLFKQIIGVPPSRV